MERSNQNRREYRDIGTISDIPVFDDLRLLVRIVEDDNGGRRLDICYVEPHGERKGGVRLNRQLAVTLLKLLREREDDIMAALFPR